MSRENGKRSHLSRLSLKFIAVVVGSAAISILLFSTLFYNRYRVFYIFNDHITVNGETSESTSKDIAKLQQSITEKKLSKDDGRKIHREMRKFKGYTMYLYDEKEDVDKEYFASSLENQSYFATSSFLIRLYDPPAEEFRLKFYDGEYTLFVYSYRGVVFMQRYILIIGAFCVFLFISLIMLFVHRKMRYVLKIGNEMKRIEEGDLHHTIVYKGNDEITMLAKQLNHLRNALYDNTVREEEARKANEELVTAMSHDLRTPLTSLMGYLDILDMKIYKSDEERDSYIKKSKQKANQIKAMSDKLFNHFLVFAQRDEIECVSVSGEEIKELLHIFTEELKERHFDVYDTYDKQDFEIRADHKLLVRVFDNLFSNICKYASKDIIVITLCIHQGQAIVKVKNGKKKNVAREQSTHIGLKSVQRMVREMGGNVVIEDAYDCFSVQLNFPCREKKTLKQA